ncbi:MAG: hypothetical protein ABSF54_13800 [Bryobacteraceae bacterium]|jgi:hypothetical protein
MEPERALSSVISVALGLVLSPFAGLLAGVLWFEAGGGAESGMVVSLAAGVAALVLIVWKSRGVLRRFLGFMDAKVPEPVHSCIILGGVGAFAFGGVLFAAILLLGHERPMGWEFSRIPPLMGLSFVLFSIVGLPVGLSKRRRAPVP